MILTDQNFTVTLALVERANMLRVSSKGTEIGIPVDPLNDAKGLSWVNMEDLKEENFDSLEIYFEERGKANLLKAIFKDE